MSACLHFDTAPSDFLCSTVEFEFHHFLFASFSHFFFLLFLPGFFSDASSKSIYHLLEDASNLNSTLCLFPDSMQYEMLYNQKYSPTCSVCMDGCTHNVCISPAGNVSPCLALLDIARPFSQFRNWNDLSTFCRSEILQILRQPLLEQCPECFLFAHGLCQGACLGHKKKFG